MPQFTTEVDGQTLHFAHIRSANPAAVPLLISHDWPGSFALYLPVIDELTADFHLVLVSNPGVAFSGPLTSAGWNTGRWAASLNEIMARLGYRAVRRAGHRRRRGGRRRDGPPGSPSG